MIPSWAYPGAHVRCISDAPDNGIPIGIKRNEEYVIKAVHENGYISKIGSSVTVAIVNGPKRNEFWLDRFAPAELSTLQDRLNRVWSGRQ